MSYKFEHIHLVRRGKKENGDDSKETQPEEDEVAENLPELKTCPFDPRFPHTNQTKHCFISFVDFQRCSRVLGEYDGCSQLQQCYKSLCPNEWIERWEEQIEAGTFPVKLPPKKEDEEENLEETEEND